MCLNAIYLHLKEFQFQDASVVDFDTTLKKTRYFNIRCGGTWSAHTISCSKKICSNLNCMGLQFSLFSLFFIRLSLNVSCWRQCCIWVSLWNTHWEHISHGVQKKKQQENRRRKIKSRTHFNGERKAFSFAAFATNWENYFDDFIPPELNLVSALFSRLAYVTVIALFRRWMFNKKKTNRPDVRLGFDKNIVENDWACFIWQRKFSEVKQSRTFKAFGYFEVSIYKLPVFVSKCWRKLTCISVSSENRTSESSRWWI